MMQVEKAAYLLLRERAEPRFKEILQKHNPWDFFERLPIFDGHSSSVHDVAISPDGQTLVSGSEDYSIKVWNLHTGALLRTFYGYSDFFYSVAISPDGQTIVSGGRNITVWEIQ